MSDFAPAVALVLENEGSSYREQDYGRGPSRYGITLMTYREFVQSDPPATATDIANLDPVTAAGFYKTHFWLKFNIFTIDDQAVANKALDLAVLDGPQTSIRWLQTAVGALPDGILGPDTMKKVAEAKDQAAVLQRIRAQAEIYYRKVVFLHPEKQKELNGWLARLAKINASTPTLSLP